MCVCVCVCVCVLIQALRLKEKSACLPVMCENEMHLVHLKYRREFSTSCLLYVVSKKPPEQQSAEYVHVCVLVCEWVCLCVSVFDLQRS